MDYIYWRSALAGDFGPVHDGHPQPGFWRRRAVKGGAWQAVAIWRDHMGLMFATCDGKVDNADALWTWVCRNPITEELYRAIERGEPWPDDIGHNQPPADEVEADEIESAIAAALAIAKTMPASQADADILANHRDRLAKLYKAQEAAREAEKRPHLEAGRAVDMKFKAALTKIEAAGKAVKAVLTVWLNAETERVKRESYERMKAEEEARRVALAANQPPPEPMPLPEVAKPKAGTTGRATALRTVRTAVITDYAKALAHFAETPLVRETVDRLAAASARDGLAVPGVEIKEERVAA